MDSKSTGMFFKESRKILSRTRPPLRIKKKAAVSPAMNMATPGKMQKFVVVPLQ